MPDPVSRQFVFIIGTRAQLIKVAPVLVACEKRGLTSALVMTGQHKETMDDLIAEFGIRSPQFPALDASEHSTIGSLLGWLPSAYAGVKARLRERRMHGRPMDVLVHGDTLSTLVGALAGRRNGSRVVHLESGLTSGHLFDPFPEEACRRLVFRYIDVAMCPNESAANLMRKRCASVVDTAGNTIVDAVRLSGANPLERNLDQPYIVASLHRFQNIYNADRLGALIKLIIGISAKYPIHFVVHPSTKGRLKKAGLLKALEQTAGVHLSPRLGYRAFLRLAAGAACVLTDGGSNQEELAVLGVPTIIMRSHTERQDGLGANSIMESNADCGVLGFIVDGRFESLRQPPTPLPACGPSERIVESLLQDEPAGGRLQ